MSGIAQNLMNAAESGVKYVSETLTGSSAQAKAELNEQNMKSDQTSLAQKATAAGEWIGNKSDQKSAEGKAEVHKQNVKNS